MARIPRVAYLIVGGLLFLLLVVSSAYLLYTLDPRTVPPDMPGENDVVQWDAVLSAFTFRVRALVPGEERLLRHLERLGRWQRSGGRRRRSGGGGDPAYGDLSEGGCVLFDACHGDEELSRSGLRLARQPEERLTASEVVPAVLELAEGHYRTLWDGCSEAERAVLRQVAEKGVVNSRREWTKGKAAGQTVGGLLTAALVLVALFLFLTQPEFFDLSLAFVSAVGLAVPALLRLVGGMGRSEGAG